MSCQFCIYWEADPVEKFGFCKNEEVDDNVYLTDPCSVMFSKDFGCKFYEEVK